MKFSHLRISYRYLCHILLWVLLGAVLCISLASAQDDVLQLGKDYQNSYKFGADLLNTLVWSCAYLLIYTCALVLTLSYFQLFISFDGSMFLWIILLWLGGLGANYLSYSLAPHSHLVAALIAVPLIFTWSLLLGTRSFADLTLRHALMVSLVVALVCAPYFGPTWQTKKVAPTDQSLAPSSSEGGSGRTPFPLAGLQLHPDLNLLT